MNLLFATLSLLIIQAVSFAQAPTMGPNVNMVTGTGLGTGDPFLQRQNEPSIAVSSRNANHLMGVANDYRLVDVPGLLDGSDEVGDVWLGIYRSTDGGAKWESTVLPGCPYAIAACQADPASPIKNRMAAADGTIRPGPNGMFLMNGIAFDRGKNALGNIFVSRFIDLNNKENGNPIAYLDTINIDTGTSGQFLDKPWITTALVPGTTKTCTVGGTNGVPSQTFPAFDVYLVYAKFTGSADKPSSSILFTKSEDCGKSWSNPIKLSESNSMNQGTAIAVNPVTGDIQVAWRRSATSSDTDAIMVTKWTRSTNRWVQPALTLASLPPNTFFDQPKITGSALAFRSKAFPTLAVDQAGRVYVAWSQRNTNSGTFASNARIVVARSNDGLSSWSQIVADPQPGGGHQFMPALSFAGGRLMLVYYDNRESQTYGLFTPARNAQGQPIAGEWTEQRVSVMPNRDLAFTGASQGQYVVDIGGPPSTRILPRLHTVDVRGVQANTLDAGFQFGASFRISQYRFGSPTPGQPGPVVQLEYNPPNFPMFARGTSSFMGDYVDVAAPVYLPTSGGGWQYNTSDPQNAIFHTTWADNRNVRPPKSPATWQSYTPPSDIVGGAPVPSLYDPSQSRLGCTPGLAGMRNQDIYTARISGGLIVSSPTNVKSSTQSGSILTRAYAVVVQNQTKLLKYFKLTIASPTNGTASFTSTGAQLVLFAAVAPRSSISRTVFINSPNQTAKISAKVNVVEVTAADASGTVVPSGLSSSTVVNPDIVNPDIVNPDIVNPDIVNPDIVKAESYNPDIVNPDIVNPDIVNPDIVNPDIVNPDIVNPDIVNPDIVNPDIVNPDIVNPDIVNPDIVNPDIVTADIAASYSDTTYTVKNTGNTASSYLTKLFSRGGVSVCQPGQVSTTTNPCIKLQLFLTKKNTTNTIGPNGCKITSQIQNQTVAIVNSPTFTPLAQLSDPSTVNATAVTNPSLALQPGEQAQLTIRSFGPNFNPRNFIIPVVVAQAPKSASARAPITLTITNPNFPDALRGLTYSATVTTIGSVLAESANPLDRPTFVIETGSLPPGLSLTPDPGNRSNALISGTTSSSAAGTYSFTVKVFEDPPYDPVNQVNLPLRIATQAFTIRIVAPLLPPLSGGTLPPAAAGLLYTQQIAVQGGQAPLTFTLAPGSTLPAGLSLTSTGLLSGTPTAGGSFSFVVEVRDSSCIGSACTPQLITITLNIVVDATPPMISANLPNTAVNGYYGSGVTLTWTVTDPESGIASQSGCGPVTITQTTTITCTATNGAGLTAMVSRTVAVDNTAPALTRSISGTLGLNGWYTSNVTVSWTVSDPETGAPACAPVVITADTAGQFASCTSTNGLGQSSTDSITIKVDRTAPIVTIAAPLNGATLPLGSTFTANYSCSDAMSGLASCAGPVPVGRVVSVTLGESTFTVTARDNAGNIASATSRYNSLTFQFNGFLNPLVPVGSFAGSSNLGKALPLKFELLSGPNQYVTDLAAVTTITSYFNGARQGTVPCVVNLSGTAFVLYNPTIGATGGSEFRLAGTTFTFNWNTSTANGTGKGCYTVAVQLSDGSAPKAISIELN